MILKVKAGRRRPNLIFRIISFIYSLFSTERAYVFLPESKYRLQGVDQFDINKLFGYFIGSIHLWSVRWGFLYNPETDLFQLYEYRYIGGKRHFKKHLEIPAGQEINLGINKKTHEVYYRDSRNKIVKLQNIDTGNSYPKTNIRFFSGFYFGGDNTAPKDLYIITKMKKLLTAMASLNGRTRMIVSFVVSIICSFILPLAVVTALTGYESNASIITAIAGFVMTFVLNSHLMKITDPFKIEPNSEPNELDYVKKDMKNTELQSPSQLGQPSQEG
jgi:hypothetical protein